MKVVKVGLDASLSSLLLLVLLPDEVRCLRLLLLLVLLVLLSSTVSGADFSASGCEYCPRGLSCVETPCCCCCCCLFLSSSMVR